jgi:hypothetical protein
MTVFMGIMLCAWTAQAAMKTELQPCAKQDFTEFIAAFAELTVQQQAACVRFPLKIRGKTYTAQQAYLRSPEGKSKFIAAKKEVEKHGKAATPFFLPLPPDKNLDQFDLASRYVYILAKDDNKHTATLTEGGTLQFETVEFLWSGEQWRILEVREGESH